MDPRLLNNDRKEWYMHECQNIIKCLQIELDLLCWVITGDETWTFEYDSETKRQRSRWGRSKQDSQSHVDHVLRYEGHRPQQDLATEPDDQSVSLQRDFATYASFSER